jgi:hypothetical protein
VLRPLVDALPAHIQDLSSTGVFIAGTTDETLTRNAELFDVVYDADRATVTVNAHAKAGLKMCQIHRELSALLDKAIAMSPDITSHEIIAVVARKTESILGQLRLLVPEGRKLLTEEIIDESVKANDALKQWLCRLATAEGLLA